MTIYAIDPGPHTGIFAKYVQGCEGETFDWTHDLNRVSHMWNWLDDWVIKSDTVIVESFEFRKEDAQNRSYIDYSPGELVGVVKLYCQLRTVNLVIQSASTGKGFWDNDKLKRAGVWSTCDSKHSRDAARHWLHYYTTTLGNDEYLHKLRK
jgi:hypothetical protein